MVKTHLQTMARAVFAVGIALCTQLAAHAVTTNVNVATACAASSFHTINLQQFADEVAKASNGQVRFRPHPAGTLLKPTEIFKGVRQGKAEAGEVIMSSLAKEIPVFGMDALPFIVSGYPAARRMWEVSRLAVEKALNDRGLQLLYAVAWPPQNLYSRAAITSIKGFKGLSMRTYNHATVRISELIGAKPVTIQVIDLSRSIAEAKLDLMLTSSWTGVETKAWSQMQYYYKVNAWFPKNVVFISKRFLIRWTPIRRKKFSPWLRQPNNAAGSLARTATSTLKINFPQTRSTFQTLTPTFAAISIASVKTSRANG